MNKHRMNKELSSFAARLREHYFVGDDVRSLILQNRKSKIGNQFFSGPPHVGSCENEFNTLALELFALQLKHNPAYRKICAGRKLMPGAVEHWTEIPVVPTAMFKELELTCIPPAERTAVFHSSGTTEQKPSRHFHSAESLAIYEASSWSWFEAHLLRGADRLSASSEIRGQAGRAPLLILTPPPAEAPHSSLVHMFETIRQNLGAPETAFVGKLAADGSWTLDFDAMLMMLNSSLVTCHPSLLLGTAFSFVHLLDHLAENNLSFSLPAGSRVMETGGYKNRSRSLPKIELHRLITEKLGVPPENIVCEYGMSELSSQGYALGAPAFPGNDACNLHFPPWSRVQIISPETGSEVAGGETGLIRVFDLANIFSVMAVQTEDLGIRHGDGFELIGRAALAEARGCSLMTI